MNCRHCGSPLSITLADLGDCPPSNAYLSSIESVGEERQYPLKVMVCSQCRLAQTVDVVDHRHLFADDYAYLSSYSNSWLDHSRRYVQDMTNRFGLDEHSRVVEVAANDGYLLQYVRDLGIPCYGIEPTKLAADKARERSIEIVEDFFGVRLAAALVGQGKQANLMTANNVLAHVPDINDFVRGFSILLKPEGVATFEFPHLLNLIRQNQFDTIYHEHFSYLSLYSVNRIFSNNGLEVFDVEELPTHGGSLRVYAQRADTHPHAITSRVGQLLDTEKKAGMQEDAIYLNFSKKLQHIKNDLLTFLIEQNRSGKLVVAYGAAAKGNTLMNFTGVKRDYVPYVVDRNPSKMGKLMPGSHIPIVGEERIKHDHPDFILILPWNIRDEIVNQLSYVREWGGRFVSAIPDLQVMS
jgi:SAM-dependent methyltransferase